MGNGGACLPYFPNSFSFRVSFAQKGEILSTGPYKDPNEDPYRNPYGPRNKLLGFAAGIIFCFCQEAGEATDEDAQDDVPQTPQKRTVLPACMKVRPSDDVCAVSDDDDDHASDNHPDDQFTQHCARLINTHIALIADKGGSDKALGESIARTTAGKYTCNDHQIPAGKGSVLIVVDPANMTESSAHPHLRKAQIPTNMIERCVNSGTVARSIATKSNPDPDPSELLGCDDVWLMFDGGRQVENNLMKPFKRATNRNKFTVLLTYDEESVITNIGRVSAMGALKLTESIHLVTTTDWTCVRRVHAHYNGSNFSDQLGPIVADNWDEDHVWKLSRKDKKALMDRFKVEVGGSVEAGLATNSKWKTKDEEPVWFHQKPYLLCDELVHSFFGKAVIDYSPSCGHFAMVCMRKRLPYVGITCSDMHSEELLKHLLELVKAAVLDPDDALYREEFAKTEEGTKHEEDGQPNNKRQKRGTADKEKVGTSARKDPKKDSTKKGNLMNKLKGLMGGEGEDDDEADPDETGADS